MYIVYRVSGCGKVTGKSNEDLELIFSTEKNRTKVEIKAKADLSLVAAVQEISHAYGKEDLFFVNGYQSWTDSFEYRYDKRLKDAKSIFPPIRNTFALSQYGDSFFYEYKKNVFHGYDVSYIKGENPLFVGNLNYRTAYLIIEHHKKKNLLLLKSDVENIHLEAGKSISLFDYVISVDIKKGMEEYFGFFRKPSAKKLFGYTSWYNHYQNIDENVIQKALNESSPDFELFQIDDGYETYVGDWLDVDQKKFPNGLSPLVEKIHKKGMMAGIWLAPFAAEKNSKVFKSHPEWFVTKKNGKPLKAGANWSGFYALNLDVPDAVSYIKKFLSFYLDLGFDFFKLDFLYAINLVPLKGLSRAQTAQKAYSLLRSIFGEKLILGCGAVTSNSCEVFDYLRIGPDVSLIFDDVWYMRHLHRERISTKITIRNTIYRSFFNGRAFLNDPDVFVLRNENVKLSPEQKKALVTINALFGSLFLTSDNPASYGTEQKKVLEEALNLFRNGNAIGFQTKKNSIEIDYELDGKKASVLYDIEKGVLREL